MANMEERLETVVTSAETDGLKWHTIVHGDENSLIETENGDVPTVAKQLKDIREAITGGVSDGWQRLKVPKMRLLLLEMPQISSKTIQIL